MRPHLLALALVAALAGCQPADAPTNASTPAASQQAGDAAVDAAFADLSKRAMDTWMQLSPVSATQIGDHRYDSELDDLSAAGQQKTVAAYKALLGELDKIEVAKLGRENQVDAAILRNQLQSEIWNAEVLQSGKWDPQLYNGIAGSAIYGLMAREFAPLPERLKAATARMEKLPAIFAQARENLDPARVPKIHAETVAKQNKGILSIVDTFITPHIGELPQADQQRLQAAIDGLKKAVDEQQTWLDKTLVPNAKGDFRIGAEKYDQKLKFALSSSLSRQEIGERARAELKRVREDMYGIAQTVLKDKPGAPEMPAQPTDEQQQKAIEAALELAYADKPARDKVVDDAKAALEQSTAFVREHDLMTLPDAPVDIILMPEFQRGVAVAYCDSPGPLDKNLKTFYAVSPIPDDWSEKQVDSFLREYNSRMIHLLSIHEGTPGHYLEGWHSAKFPSTLRAVLRSGLFAEGWAVYTERMMQEQGYLNNDPLFHLVQLKFYLRTISNAILDQGVHVDNWDREKAMHLMTHDAFQQESEAAGKWVRAQLTSAQLPTYFVGAQEHFDTRKAVQEKLGDKFNLKAYHDQVLSYGAPPVRFARQLMLDQPIE
ncbi:MULTISPECIES: DUF885 domain-containing protein [Stenotrophomonas maltophilia group]|uniref:DUF885 domain-containing protein n=1 Tax=Stenotrophomonas TaxID=40323 RepID=UPI0006A8E607|nr:MULTISPECIES: DUF885 domain-containing protein [Stenotrophomonas maltophilia group]MBA0271137.1 DUF885 domain-containing protein [Stenotrophomonas maltophilia]MCZ7843733.1 DUF885 domain-containing protein [Stenotrophomonas maltophilia]MDJ1624641.1 DUF885 domain-containing protein [Stenotrophomonas sepilia]MDT3488872.1 DUF885 domain-containing protein [Stenotrophomonas maltophilia group sp. msm4]PSD27485.1 DUF885 domain-containing protein [Stenotrophomonas maltophilia]